MIINPSKTPIAPVLIGILLCLLSFVHCRSDDIIGGEGTPEIEFTYVPPYNSFENQEGKVKHVKPADYRVAVYIYVSGWWTKPYWDSPKTSIRDNGAWECDITTGGIDEKATKITAFLIPKDYDPPLMSGGGTLPDELAQIAVDKTETERS